MKKFLLVGTALVGAVGIAAADSVDVTLGASLDMGWDYGLGKVASSSNGFGMLAFSGYQQITAELALAGTTDAGLRFGAEVTLSTADVLRAQPYGTTSFARKYAFQLRNSSNEVNMRGGGYNISGGEAISAEQIVAVKINSEWASKEAPVTSYAQQLGGLGINDISNICKLAGRYADDMNGRAATGFGSTLPAGGAAVAPVFRTLVGNGRAIDDDIHVDTGGLYGQVLRPGQFKAQRQIWATGAAGGTNVVPPPVGGPIGARISVNPVQPSSVARPGTAAAVFQTGFPSQSFTAKQIGSSGFPRLLASTVASRSATVLFSPGINELAGEKVNRAKVFLGPYMEARMTSSTTKLVVGAVCLSHQLQKSATQIHMDLASRVPQVGNASIFVEGGFGKLTLQKHSYPGAIDPLGNAGDRAGIGIDGDNAGHNLGNGTGLRTAIAILEDFTFLGLKGYGAVDVSTVSLSGRPNYVLGTSFDLFGLKIAFEIEDNVDPDPANENPEDGYIDHWDATTGLEWHDVVLDVVTDSDGDWALGLGYALFGFSAEAVIENVAKGQNQKAGLSIDATLAAQIDGLEISLDLDEDLAWGLSGRYSLGNAGLALYATYDASEAGGSIGSRLTF